MFNYTIEVAKQGKQEKRTIVISMNSHQAEVVEIATKLSISYPDAEVGVYRLGKLIFTYFHGCRVYPFDLEKATQCFLNKK